MIGKIYRPTIKVNKNRGISLNSKIVTYSNKHDKFNLDINMLYDIDNITEEIFIKYDGLIPLVLSKNYELKSNNIAINKDTKLKHNKYIKFRKILKPTGEESTGKISSICQSLSLFLKISDRNKEIIDNIDIVMKIGRYDDKDCLFINIISDLPIRINSENIIID